MPTYHNPYSPNSVKAMTLSETQMQDNAVFIWGYMHNKYDWTLNAVSGMLGNIEAECEYNPKEEKKLVGKYMSNLNKKKIKSSKIFEIKDKKIVEKGDSNGK